MNNKGLETSLAPYGGEHGEVGVYFFLVSLVRVKRMINMGKGDMLIVKALISAFDLINFFNTQE